MRPRRTPPWGQCLPPFGGLRWLASLSSQSRTSSLLSGTSKWASPGRLGASHLAAPLPLTSPAVPFPPVPSGPASSGAPFAAPPSAKRPKLSSLVDVTAEAELQKLPPTLIQEAYAKYATSRGGLPRQDMEPSDEQLSAIHQLVTAGDPPYVDFSIFGPHGRRMLKRLTFVSQTLDFASGEWKRQELPGPPDFNAWWRSWKVLRTALLLLEISPPEPLDLYGEHIRTLTETFGQHCWSIIYMADVRMRSEEFERTLRRYTLNHESLLATTGSGLANFDPRHPWGYVFLQSVHSANHHATAYWSTEVEKKCLLLMCRLKSEAELLHDGTIAASGSSARTPYSLGSAPPPGKGSKRNTPGGSKTPSGRGRTRAGGGPRSVPRTAAAPQPVQSGTICRNFNSGTCTRSPCGFAHRCAICNKPGHPAWDCYSASPAQKDQYPHKGKSKGKGKQRKAS